MNKKIINNEIEEVLKKMIISPELLENSGYKSFTDPRSRTHETYLISYQKKVCSSLDNGVLYFINLSYYYLSKDIMENYPESRRLGLTCDMQMTSVEEGFTTNIEFSVERDTPLDKVEAYCMKMFKNMNFEYNEYGYMYSREQHLKDIEKTKIIQEKHSLDNLIGESNKKENIYKL